MWRASLSVLACPSCRRGFELVAHHEVEGDVIGGLLACDGCGVIIPIVEGFALITEAGLHEGQASPTVLAEQAGRLFGDIAAYESYRVQKDDRDLWESYAAFQPFNESTRAAEPLLPAIRAHLKPGDFILATWDRSGWSGEWLAGLFPDNRVISLWEGDTSVLGYRGFRYWLGHGRRAPNLDFLFVPPNRPLPFKTDSFGFIYAYDSLHRYEPYPFAGECLRVASPDAALLFAHLHLTNAQPDPFFERGCRQQHGRDYKAWLDRALKGDRRCGSVLSEEDLFDARPGEALNDNPDTGHYNGEVLIADPARAAIVAPAAEAPPAQAHLLVNPLLRLDLTRGSVLVDDAMKDGDVGHLLERHPVYRRRLPKGARPLSGSDWRAVCLAAAGRAVGEIGHGAVLAGLIADEILLPVLVSPQALALQRFHANQLPVVAPDRLLAALFDALAASDEAALVLADGSALSGREAARTLAALMTVLAGEDGKTLSLNATDDPLAFLVLLAAIASGRDIALGAGEPSLSLYDGETGIARRLERALDAGAPPPDFGHGASITIPGADGSIQLDPSALVEAAASLRHAVRRDLSGVADFAGVNTLLLCLTSLFRGEPVTFGGLARPVG